MMLTIKQYPLPAGQRFTLSLPLGSDIIGVESVNGVAHVITQEPVNSMNVNGEGGLPMQQRQFIVLRVGNTYEPFTVNWRRAVFRLPDTSMVAVLMEEQVHFTETPSAALRELLPLDAPQVFQEVTTESVNVTEIAERHVKKPALAELVMGAMLQLGGQVTVLDVANLIVRDKQRVASELSALARQGKLRKIERGVYALPLGDVTEVTAESPQEVA